MVVREPSRASITIRHEMVAVRCEEVIKRGESSISEFICTPAVMIWPIRVILNQIRSKEYVHHIWIDTCANVQTLGSQFQMIPDKLQRAARAKPGVQYS
jgi:hypothetical protein